MAPLLMRTRSPVLKVGAHSWVTTLVVPSSMRRVIRSMRSPAAPVLPAVLELPMEVEPLVPALPGWRWTTSMLVTVLFGAALVAPALVPVAAPVPDPLPAMAPLPVVLLPVLLPMLLPLPVVLPVLPLPVAPP